MRWSALALLLVASCGPKGRLALPEQNVAESFVAEEGYRPKWTWSVPGGPAVLALSKEGPYEMVWTVSEKSLSRVRRSRIASLQRAPRFFSQGPDGVTEVRFSPSGETILAHEYSKDGTRFQTVLFQHDDYTGAWSSRYLDLGKPAETKWRKLDDKTRAPGLLGPAVPPVILRLDEEQVIYEVEGKTKSLAL